MIRAKLTPKEIEAISRAIARGEYSLLLGAGASVGGLGGDGRELPTARALIAEMVVDFDLPANPDETTLPAAYSAAGRRRDQNGHDRAAYFLHRFTNCTPPTWQKMLPEFIWRRIWTLNLDDSVKLAYESTPTRRQSLAVRNWAERHVDDIGSLQLVHLHGMASRPADVVFSVIEYVRATAEQHAWHRIFGDHFSEAPFIVIGARLQEEFDLAAILERGSASRDTVGLPSLVVLKSAAPLVREQLEESGLIVIEAKAEDFLYELSQSVAKAEKDLAGTVGLGGDRLSAQARQFLQQFRQLRLDAPPPLKTQDFYAGYEPRWFDIQQEHDALLDPVLEIIRELEEDAKMVQPRQNLKLIHGPMGSGKSTALLRCARILIGSGKTPYLFEGDSVVDVESTLWWISRVPDSVLLFDGVADHAVALAEILDTASEEGLSVCVVGSEREKRVKQVYGVIPAAFIGSRGGQEMRFLSDRDIYRLLDKLRSRSRLGALTQKSPTKQRLYFEKVAKRQIWAGMASLEGGGGFVARLRGEFDAIDLRWINLVACTALSYSFGYPLPVGVASVTTGIDPRLIIAELRSGSLDEWLRLGNHGVEFRHRLVASMVVERALNTDTRYRLTLALAKALAPIVDRAAISRRSIAYRIARNILDADAVRDLVGHASLSWYAELEAFYGWNARYWEQRALAHVTAGDLAAARSYAERAVSILRDPFTLTTLASVVLRQSGMNAATSSAWEEQYWGGVELLAEAKQSARVFGDHPQSVFFNQTLSICESLPIASTIPAAVVQEFELWLHEYERGLAAAYAQNAAWLTTIRMRWVQAQVEHATASS